MPELAKTYDPAGTEARWQQAWEDQGAFHPDPKALPSALPLGQLEPFLRQVKAVDDLVKAQPGLAVS